MCIDIISLAVGDEGGEGGVFLEGDVPVLQLGHLFQLELQQVAALQLTHVGQFDEVDVVQLVVELLQHVGQVILVVTLVAQ